MSVPLSTYAKLTEDSRVTPLVLEAFIVRLFREKNKEGFVKAFTDQPEHITSGLSPLKNIMKELQIRNVHIYPRYIPLFVDCSIADTPQVSRRYQKVSRTAKSRRR